MDRAATRIVGHVVVEDADDLASVRLLRMGVSCPACSAPPKLRVPPWVASLLKYAPAEIAVMTYECHIRSCGTRYAIRVRDMRGAA